MNTDQNWRHPLPADHIRIVTGLLVVLFCLTVSVATRDILLGEPDLWWHIKTGNWMWQHAAVPTADPFSHTFAGKPWIAKEWLSQLIYFGAYQLGGWNAVSGLGVLSVGLGMALLYWAVSAWMKPNIAASIVIACMLLGWMAFTIRPHLLTLPLLVAWTAELFRSSLKGRAPHFAALAIIVLWANLHAAFTIGFVIAAFAFLDFVENTRLKQRAELLKWIAFLVLCPLATLLHPYGYKAMMATLWIFRPNEGGIPLIEWQPLNAQRNVFHVGVLLGLAFAAIASGFRLGLARAALIVLLTYLFMKSMRYGFYLFPVMAIVAVPAIAQQFPRLSAQRWRSGPVGAIGRRIDRDFRPMATSIAGIIAALLGAQWFLPTNPPEEVAATAAIRFVKSQGVSGNVMNQYNFGGPLVFNDIKTFIDGRTDQLFIGEFQKMVASGLSDAAGLSKALDSYKIDWTMMRPKDPETKLLDTLPGWKRIYADEYAVIHQRERPPAK